MDLNRTMNQMRKMMPGRKQGMSTGSIIMLMAVPVILYAVGKMISSRRYDD